MEAPPASAAAPTDPAAAAAMPAEPDDRALIARVLGGDPAAFDPLMRRHERAVYHAAWGFTRAREDAQDLAQTAFLKAYRQLLSFRGEASFRTWLLRIVAHEGINWLKRRRRHPEGPGPLGGTEGLPDHRPLREQSLLADEQRTLLVSGLERIHGRYRLALELRYFREMPLREIAQVLDCSEVVVKNLLFRGVRSLRAELGRPG